MELVQGAGGGGLIEILSVFGISDLVSALIAGGVAVVVARFTFAGKLAEASQSREAAIWDASRSIREDLAERIAKLEADRDRMTTELSNMHQERVNDSYVRAYARLLVETFPNPPGPPEAPPVVAALLGIEVALPRPRDGLGDPPPHRNIRDPTKPVDG